MMSISAIFERPFVRVFLRRRTLAGLTCFALVGATAGQAPAQEATELGMLVEQMADVAHQVSAKNEELKASEDELKELEGELARAQDHAGLMSAQADDAARRLVEQQLAVDSIANSRYRGMHMNTLTTTLASGSPQDAVDRLGYMGALSRDAQRNLTTMSRASVASTQAREEASTAVAVVEATKRAVEQRRAVLVQERDALEEQQRDIEERVDSLTPDQRAAWEGQFNPIDPATLLDLFRDSGGLVQAALSQQGAPYGWGMAGPSQFDCSGLMYWSHQQQGKTIPRTSQEQIAGGTPVPLDELQPGDIVGYYPGITHVGMYIGNGQVVHASTYGVPVQVVPLHSMPVQGAARY